MKATLIELEGEKTLVVYDEDESLFFLLQTDYPGKTWTVLSHLEDIQNIIVSKTIANAE